MLNYCYYTAQSRWAYLSSLVRMKYNFSIVFNFTLRYFLNSYIQILYHFISYYLDWFLEKNVILLILLVRCNILTTNLKYILCVFWCFFRQRAYFTILIAHFKIFKCINACIFKSWCVQNERKKLNSEKRKYSGHFSTRVSQPDGPVIAFKRLV